MTSKELLLHEIELMSEKQLHEMLILAQSIKQKSSSETRKDIEEIITSEISTPEILTIAENSPSFDFLQDEPDIYTLEDGVPI